jgi:hypothetical protein
MKKFLFATLAIGVLSTAAFASNDNSLPYGNTPDLVLPLNQDATPKIVAKKKIYYGQSSSTVNSVDETGNVNDIDRILEKGGDSHDVSPY